MSRRFQFSLRALLVVVTAFTIWLGWLAESARRQRTAINSLANIPNSHFYEGEVTIDEPGLISERKAEPLSGIRKWLADWVGIDYVADVTVLALSLHEGVPDFERLSRLPLEYLSLEAGDARLRPLDTGANRLRPLVPEVRLEPRFEPGGSRSEGGHLDQRALHCLKRMKTLRWLVLHGDVGLTDRDVSDLRQALPACRVSVLAQPW